MIADFKWGRFELLLGRVPKPCRITFSPRPNQPAVERGPDWVFQLWRFRFTRYTDELWEHTGFAMRKSGTKTSLSLEHQDSLVAKFSWKTKTA